MEVSITMIGKLKRAGVTKEEALKIQKKRGNYFHNAIHVPMSQKYGISTFIIGEIRKFALAERMTQQEICLHITNNLQRGVYDNPKNSRNYRNMDLKKLRENILAFLLRCSPEGFEEIAKVSKWDWDYKGEDRKLPDLQA